MQKSMICLYNNFLNIIEIYYNNLIYIIIIYYNIINVNMP